MVANATQRTLGELIIPFLDWLGLKWVVEQPEHGLDLMSFVFELALIKYFGFTDERWYFARYLQSFWMILALIYLHYDPC